MSEVEVTSVKTRVLKLLQDLDEAEVDEVEQWITSQSYKKDLEKLRSLNKTEQVFKKIGNTIRMSVPLEAELPTEIINMPTVGDQADCTKVNTCHVDGFLYDEDQTEDLVKKGKLSRHYCVDCQSRNIKDLIFISHSMSRLTLHYMFKVLLPSDLEGKQILDVGSRLGVVLYAAYHLSNASSIIGVEMNKECCALQERILGQFLMDSNRVKVVNSDVMECQDMISNSDIVVINSLDFFVDVEKHKEMWDFFKKNLKKSSYLVTNSSVAETLGSLGIFEEFMDWLVICKPFQIENEILFDVEDLDGELFLYAIK